MAKNREIKKHVVVESTLVLIMSKMDHDLSRYKKLYGKLPEDETKEEGTNEENKAE